MDSNAATTLGNLHPYDSGTTKKAHTLMDHIVQRATDKRRGLIEVIGIYIQVLFIYLLYSVCLNQTFMVLIYFIFSYDVMLTRISI